MQPHKEDTASKRNSSTERRYVTIYSDEKYKVELAAQNTVMRRTISSDKGEKIESFYRKVTDTEQIQRIEDRSVNWSVRGVNSQYDYIILEQKNARDKLTGNCKIIKRECAIIEKHFIFPTEVRAKNSRDWMYYKRRN